MDSDCSAGGNFPHKITYYLMPFCCDLLFIFAHYFCSLVNKMVSVYFTSAINVSALVKPYFITTFENVVSGMIGIDPILINFPMSNE